MSNFKVFVGIDFGTYGSSLAYVGPDGKARCHNLWSSDLATMKPRTSILLNNDLNVEETGANARAFYLRSSSKKIKKRGWKLFEGFKMNLYEESADKRRENKLHRQIVSVNGQLEDVEVTEKVFVGQLEYLKEEAFAFIAKNYAKKYRLTGDRESGWNEVQYFLTVPGIVILVLCVSVSDSIL